MLTVLRYDDSMYSDMLDFCNTCAELGYVNNSSVSAMKLDWCRDNGFYLCGYHDGKIVAVAGAHHFPERGENAWRIMFRGCELRGFDSFKGLGKGDWNSITQREFIPIFIKECESDELYLTTNIDHEHSNGKSQRNHRLMGLLCKQGILEHDGDEILFNTNQTIWKLNISEYTRRRNLLRGKYVL